MGALTAFDYIVLAAYVLGSLVIGLRFSKRQKSVEEYFVAGRSVSWWAAGISAVATGLSGISYLGVPAWVFQHDLQLNVAVFLLPIVMLIVIYVFVPMLARLRLMTIYQYLEIRFNVAVRTFASALFLMLRGGWLATAIYTQSLLMTELAGIPMWLAVLIVGVLTALYTTLGGIEAVLWTDVMQFFVLVGGIVVMLVAVVVGFHGSIGEMWHLAAAGGHTRWINPRINLFEITVWGVVLNCLVDNVAMYGSDQIMVQRFLTARSPSEMRRSVMFTGLISVPIIAMLALLGLGLVAYYQTHAELAATLPSGDRIVPHFIANVLPPGLAGLVVAGVFAATMSTLSGGFNSLATATVVDFIQRFRRHAPANPKRDVIIARLTTLSWALVATILSIFVGRMGSIVEIFLKINGLFAGPILGVFLLGILTRRASGTSAFIGIVCGSAFTAWVWTTHVYWLWYGPAGCSATVIAGYLASFAWPQTNPLSLETDAASPSIPAVAV